ncbi:MAG: hypothetical protein JW863_21910 [Chitinispirillaceae bacterium]|nr:hypothetical protein [Chitinispirillaceae bacterium]
MKKNAGYLLIAVLVLGITASTFAESGKKKPSVPGIAVGIGCMTGGALFSVYHYTRAKSIYEKYEKSAFTDNTKELHREVKRRDLFCILGGVAAWAGLFTMVVSF